MGIKFDKINPSPASMICPRELVDLHQAGSVYFVKHKPRQENESEIKENEIEKKTHYSLAIDVTGSSTNDCFIATHYDLFVCSPTDHTTYVDSLLKSRKWNDYALIIKLGQIPLNDIEHYYIPIRFAKEIEYRLISQVHDPMCQVNKGAKWSAVLNCQTFTRSCIKYLGFEFPSDINVISDCMPTMVNIYLHGSLLTAKVNEKSNEKLPS